MFTVALLALAQAGPGEFEDRKFMLVGVGHSSCAKAFAPENSAATLHWVSGFVTGLNAATGGNVPEHTDHPGMMGEVRLRCERAPSQRLVTAATQAYRFLNKQ